MSKKISIGSQSNGLVVFILVVALALLLLALLARAEYRLTEFWQLLTDAKFIEIVAGMLASVLVGVISSLVFARVVKSSAERRYQNLTEIAHPGLVENILTQIAEYKNTCMPTYRVSIKLHLSSCGSYIRVSQTYDYRRTGATKQELDFRFKRAVSEAQAKQMDNELEQLTDDYKKHEFFFTNDDTYLLEKGIEENILSEEYSVKDLFVNSKQTDLVRRVRSPLAWRARPQLGEPDEVGVRYQYTVTFPLDFTDYLFVVLEFPAKEATIEFDYGNLAELIDVDHVNFLGSLVGFPGSMTDSDGRITVNHDEGWLLPKSGVVFIWSKRAPS